MVVGDGESDVRLLGNLGILAAQDNRNSIVMGFFIRHEILAQMRDSYDEVSNCSNFLERVRRGIIRRYSRIVHLIALMEYLPS